MLQTPLKTLVQPNLRSQMSESALTAPANWSSNCTRERSRPGGRRHAQAGGGLHGLLRAGVNQAGAVAEHGLRPHHRGREALADLEKHGERVGFLTLYRVPDTFLTL